MDSPKLTRRTLLKAGAGAAAFATTSNIFTPLKTFAARDQKLDAARERRRAAREASRPTV